MIGSSLGRSIIRISSLVKVTALNSQDFHDMNSLAMTSGGRSLWRSANIREVALAARKTFRGAGERVGEDSGECRAFWTRRSANRTLRDTLGSLNDLIQSLDETIGTGDQVFETSGVERHLLRRLHEELRVKGVRD